MSQMSTSTGSVKPRSNVYTVLLLIAIVALIGGCVYMYIANTGLTGNANPFYLLPSK